MPITTEYGLRSFPDVEPVGHGLVLVLPILFVCYFAFKTYLGKAEENALRRQLDKLYPRTVEALSVAIDARASGTLGQARLLGIKDSSELLALETASRLHDIGKLAIDDFILKGEYGQRRIWTPIEDFGNSGCPHFSLTKNFSPPASIFQKKW